MKTKASVIKLSEIPDEGKEFHFDRQSGELNETLKDLIGDHKFQVEMNVKPIGNVFEARGTVDTMITRTCSKCGWDLEIPMKFAINEILMPKTRDGRRDSQTKGGAIEEETNVSVTYYHQDAFDAAEMVHELIGISEPAYPDCGLTECEHLKDVQKTIEQLDREAALAMGTKKAGHPAFAALQNLKVDKKN